MEKEWKWMNERMKCQFTKHTQKRLYIHRICSWQCKKQRDVISQLWHNVGLSFTSTVTEEKYIYIYCVNCSLSQLMQTQKNAFKI